ncbi:phosphonate C-P lyase system protein PhnG [Paludibacterium purpuratum]|uniref:Alpha-D-ribose 1-methylphosphonate 5-triphosphate synthase subunit PhnG n=1 Tax=Paludibacterium purpuratum TaxID=1144873 RepID=A0A4R7BDB4_9NEIS|nr:phosphonate C-P lyase system protein PhnG [Paludibacterium purpuratum]TDR82978.1 alpha-D-ribose 1-methylphosphonate 5-triphosphate synthase subunit PhnG [Paludibacterium purpuratum]
MQTRQRWLSVLANSPPNALQTLLAPWRQRTEAPVWLRRAETGLVMLQGRAGGTGARFNLAEISVTRASCRIGEQTGHGWVRGSNAEHAELIAVADALLQDPRHQAELLTQLVAPLQGALDERRARDARQAAASKVEFFTMVRGE